MWFLNVARVINILPQDTVRISVMRKFAQISYLLLRTLTAIFFFPFLTISPTQNLQAQIEGYFYDINGGFLGQIGGQPQYVYLTNWQDFQLAGNGDSAAISHLQLVGNASDVFTMAATVFAETYPFSDYNERVGIASAIKNNNIARNADPRPRTAGCETLRETTLRIAHVTHNGNPRYIALWSSLPDMPDIDMATTMRAVMLVLLGQEEDPTHSAVFWEGRNSLILQHHWRLRKMATGYEVHPEHAINTPIESHYYLETLPSGALVFFRFETTAVHGYTIFSRVHPDFIRVFGSPRY
jgi:hypothetical protein